MLFVYSTGFGQQTITAQDIYDIAALTLIIRADISPEDRRLANFEAGLIKDKITRVFDPLIRQQVQKYIDRPDRHDPQQLDSLQTYPSASYSQLEDMFNKQTFRSERHRRSSPTEIYNVNWGKLAAAMNRLNGSQDYESIAIALIGQAGLLNLIHNTNTSILDKLPQGQQLISALSMCQECDERQVLAYANPDIRSIVRKYI